MTKNNKPVTKWVGWIYFAGFMMVMAGMLQTLVSLVALMNRSFYEDAGGTLTVGNYNSWGWLLLVTGIVISIAGMSLINGRFFGKMIAMIVAMLTIVINFLFITAYPLWSITVIVMCLLTLYALAVHGKETNA